MSYLVDQDVVNKSIMIKSIYKIGRLLTILKASNTNLFNIFKKGYSLASTEILHNVSQYCPIINTVIDVGANQGQFALAAARKYPNADVYSFEPLPETYTILDQNTKDSNKIKTFNLALGSTSGILNFYKNNYSHASSALQVSDFQKDNIPGTANAELIQVPVERLDNLGKTLKLTSPTLLKLDVQGFEKEVLMGSENVLSQIDYLVFEASFTPMYEGEPSFDEMHEYVKSMGFEQVAPVGMLQTENLKILQLDMLYRRSSNRS